MRRVGAVIAVAIIAVVVLVAVGWPASEFRHNDFVGFWVGSRMLLDGRDPYDAVAWRAMHGAIGSLGRAIVPAGTGYGYPLTTALVFVPFALVPIWLAAPLWLVTQVALAGGSLVYLARVLFPASLRRDLPVLLAFGAASQPAWVLAAGGNIGGIVLAIAATSAALLLRGRPLAAGAVAGLLIVKPHPLLFAMLLMLLAVPRRDALRLVAGALASSGPLVLITLVLRPGWVSEFLVSMEAIGGAPAARASVFGALQSFGVLTWIVALLMLGAVLAWQRRARPALAPFVAVAIPISLVTAPYVWSYDHLVMLVSVAVVIAGVADAGPRVRVSMLAALAVVWVVLPWALYAIAFRRGDEAWSVAAPLAVLGVVAVATRWRSEPRTATR